MRGYLKSFFEEFEYPMEAREALLSAYDAIDSDEDAAVCLNTLLNRYEQDINCDFKQMLEEMQKAAERVSVHAYISKLLLCACMSKTLGRYYRAAGLNEEIWRASMYDLKYKLIECRLVYGIWGSFVCAWFDRFFNMTRFALGRLQFELISFGKSYEKGGICLTEESTVINVHIPRTGGRLCESEVKSSYEQAARFFKERYGLKQIVFVCHSWLLYPKNLEVLKENSNLRRFISDYDIIEWKTYRDYSEVWRLFDRNYTGNIDALPQDTSLRRAYASWIGRGEATGWGYGVYVYEF